MFYSCLVWLIPILEMEEKKVVSLSTVVTHLLVGVTVRAEVTAFLLWLLPLSVLAALMVNQPQMGPPQSQP